MIVLKCPEDQVLGALQAIFGIVQRRHTPPILAKVLIRGGWLCTETADGHLRVDVAVPQLPVQSAYDLQLARPGRKVALGRVRELRGFFGATKVNARNAP